MIDVAHAIKHEQLEVAQSLRLEEPQAIPMRFLYRPLERTSSLSSMTESSVGSGEQCQRLHLNCGQP